MNTAANTDGTTIVFEDTGGDGPAVILVHGITESRSSWQPIVDRLSATHRVIALGGFIPSSTVEYWPDHGHYPHLVDPDRFVKRLTSFWTSSA